MDEEHTNGNTHSGENGFLRLDSQSINDQFKALIRYWVKKQLRQPYQSILDVDQIANDSMCDFIARIMKAEDPSALDLIGLCRVITVRKVIEAVRRVGRRKRIGASHLKSIVLAIEVRDFHSDSSPADQAATNDMRETVLRSLSLRQQRILTLRIDGWTPDEIAVSCNVSIKTIRRQLNSIATIVRYTRSEFNTDELFSDPKEQRTENREQRTENREQRTENREQRTAWWRS